MKKILSIISVAEANQCSSLETDYKIERKNLKRYEESLRIFKARISQNVLQMKSISKSMEAMHQSQSKSRKKTSEIEYYMFNGIKVFGALISVFGCSASYYEDLLKRGIDVEVKIGKCLKEQKKKYDKIREQHEKEIKTFATECYPETNSILFTIGLVSAEKVTKKPDSFREMSIVEQSKRYSNFLKSCLEEMEQLKKEAIQIGENFYTGAKDMWIQGVDQFRQTLDTFEIDQEEINKLADETGRVLTDRSIKSNDGQQHHPEPEDENKNTEPQPEIEPQQENQEVPQYES